MNGKEIFKDVPVLTEENCDRILPDEETVGAGYYGELKDCIEVLKKKYKDIVDGLWFVAESAMDGGTIFILRTKEEIGDPHIRCRMHSDIFKFTGHEFCYRITDESTQGLFELPIDEWKKEGLIFALYDTERSVG